VPVHPAIQKANIAKVRQLQRRFTASLRLSHGRPHADGKKRSQSRKRSHPGKSNHSSKSSGTASLERKACEPGAHKSPPNHVVNYDGIIPTALTTDYKRVYALPSGVPIPQARTFHSQVLSYIRSDPPEFRTRFHRKT
jgi:hypothetical protein